MLHRKITELSGQEVCAMITRARSEGRESFDELFAWIYEQCRRNVYSLCLRMLANTAEAEDLTQQVFLQLFRRIDSFSGTAAFTTWLYRLTVNEVLMHFRKVDRRVVSSDLAATSLKVQSALSDRATTAKGITARIDLERTFKQLPPGYQQALLLHDIQALTHEEISERCGCAVGTSKSQLNKARKKMRALLSGAEHEKKKRRFRDKKQALLKLLGGNEEFVRLSGQLPQPYPEVLTLFFLNSEATVADVASETATTTEDVRKLLKKGKLALLSLLRA